MVSNKTISFSLATLAVIGVFYVLVVGKTVLVPIAVAVMLWYIINALSRAYARIIPKIKEPNKLTTLASLLSIGLFAYLVVTMVQGNIADVSAAAPSYKANLSKLSQTIVSRFGLEQIPNVNEMLDSVEITPIISSLAGAFTDMIGNIFLVIIYVLFLLLEQGTFKSKISNLFPNKKQRDSVMDILTQTQDDIQTYIWIKTLTSSATGIISYFLLIAVGVDFAGFWAFTIFLLNFIPTIGSIIATLFPALLALIQFETFHQSLIILVAVGSVQVVIGNFVEPRMMGTSLNLSPFVVMLSLTLWGSVWGVAGMFLSVPITVIMLIVFAHFEKTKPIAILLSGDGNLKFVDEK